MEEGWVVPCQGGVWGWALLFRAHLWVAIDIISGDFSGWWRCGGRSPLKDLYGPWGALQGPVGLFRSKRATSAMWTVS